MVVILYFVLIIYLGYFAFDNPDPKHCYYTEGLSSPDTSIAEAESEAAKEGVTIRQGYPIDVAHLFRTWFKWGFWTSMLQVQIFIFVLPLNYFCTESVSVFNLCTLVLQGCVCCCGIAWFIFGFFWRFTRAGRVSSGDKLERVPGSTDEEWAEGIEFLRQSEGY